MLVLLHDSWTSIKRNQFHFSRISYKGRVLFHKGQHSRELDTKAPIWQDPLYFPGSPRPRTRPFKSRAQYISFQHDNKILPSEIVNNSPSKEFPTLYPTTTLPSRVME
ncbi:hypothetical protein C1H46_041151 [Malus baccata]|uniref:Uncharacterized protein n=1 Tax=Malus baccata TaxID=106549 RepID=A0A540KGN1_MALBA|nr:hypothetical protein C1H46_041151 [Malus baccata]